MERIPKQLRLLAGLIIATSLALPTSAIALPGPQGRLSPLPGTDACVSNDGSDNNGNAGVCEDGDALFNAFRVAVSPDGKSVYTAASDATPGAIGIFNRDLTAGDLDQPAGATGCVGTPPCTAFAPDNPLESVRGVVVSPDGQNVYATGAASDSVLSLKRNADGSLTPLGDVTAGARADDCVALNPGTPVSSTGCVDGKAIDDPLDIAISPDGKHVYVTATSGSGSGSGSVAVFSRQIGGPLAGKLTQVGTGMTADGGCVSSDGESDASATSCLNADGGFALNGAQGLDVSDDGNQVYVAAQFGNGISVFNRDSSTGFLSQTQCVLAIIDGGVCTDTSDGIAGAVDVDVAPDGNHVYVAGNSFDALARFVRNPATGLLTVANNCVSEGVNAGGCSVTTGRAMDGLNGVKVSPDNRTVYVAASDSNAISTFTRNISSGVATQLGGAGGCISDQPGNPVGTATCTDGVAMIGVRDIALSPNGVNVYGTSLTSRSVTAFGRQLPPQCAGGAVPGTRGPETFTIQFNCPDPNGDSISGYFVNDPPHGTLGGLNIPAGTVQYTPDPGYDGPDSFLLNAQDNAPEPGQAVTVTLDVDTVAPATTISSVPADAEDTTPTFGFDSEAGAAFECRFDGAPFAACDDATGPSGSHTAAAELGAGGHVFDVRATDAVGNAGTKATQAFSVVAATTPPPPVDTDPPETTISKTKVKGDDVTVKFTSDEAGSTFRCRVDKKPLKPCTSPRKVNNLDDGKHKFFVQATDTAGNTDASAAKSKFEVGK